MIERDPNQSAAERDAFARVCALLDAWREELPATAGECLLELQALVDEVDGKYS
jgi:hypothetical protein